MVRHFVVLPHAVRCASVSSEHVLRVPPAVASNVRVTMQAGVNV